MELQMAGGFFDAAPAPLVAPRRFPHCLTHSGQSNMWHIRPYIVASALLVSIAPIGTTTAKAKQVSPPGSVQIVGIWSSQTYLDLSDLIGDANRATPIWEHASLSAPAKPLFSRRSAAIASDDGGLGTVPFFVPKVKLDIGYDGQTLDLVLEADLHWVF